MNKLVTEYDHTTAAVDAGRRIFSRLAEAFIDLGEVKEILDKVTPAQKKFLEGEMPQSAKVRMTNIRSAMEISDGLYALDDKEFGYGKSTAKYWLANIICAAPQALDDYEIDLAELKKAKNCPDPNPTPDDISKAESILSTIDYE